ncbi:hypothetical protein G9A89_010112 [Geosiphon pyriformis]|nr:hypothetical protein G9A89_010112 [Geosiphon pyriformis]
MSERVRAWVKDVCGQKIIKFIPIEELENLTWESAGKFGTVSTAHWERLRDNVALQMQLQLGYNDRIVRILGLSQDMTTLYYLLVMQYCNGGNLRQYLKRNWEKLTWENIFHLALGIAEGIRCHHLEISYIVIWSAEVDYELHLAYDILNGIREATLDGTPPEYQEIYEKYWAQNPEDRPNIETVVEKLEMILGKKPRSFNAEEGYDSGSEALALSIELSPEFLRTIRKPSEQKSIKSLNSTGNPSFLAQKIETSEINQVQHPKPPSLAEESQNKYFAALFCMACDEVFSNCVHTICCCPCDLNNTYKRKAREN